MLGTTISLYKILEKIGEGGMGEVYRAEDTNLSSTSCLRSPPRRPFQDLLREELGLEFRADSESRVRTDGAFWTDYLAGDED
jgi:serine/threonine protein kinase